MDEENPSTWKLNFKIMHGRTVFGRTEEDVEVDQKQRRQKHTGNTL